MPNVVSYGMTMADATAHAVSARSKSERFMTGEQRRRRREDMRVEGGHEGIRRVNTTGQGGDDGTTVPCTLSCTLLPLVVFMCLVSPAPRVCVS
jgi:hypothetical protein